MPKSTAIDDSGPAKRLLLISGYDAASHRYWRRVLQRELTQYCWTQIALPDRFYAWRIRGNGFTLAEQFASELSKNYDGMIVTSMVDLNSLRGFCPNLANIPTMIYCHENQFDYPSNSQPTEQANRLNAQLSAIFSMKCADRVLFNSVYNQNTFFQGANRLFKKLPDGVSLSTLKTIEQKSSVLPVPINIPSFDRLKKTSNQQSIDEQQKPKEFSIVWNHRWEFDKQPEVFFDAIRMIENNELQFSLHILGQSFRKIPECFSIAEIELGDRIESWGFQPQTVYHQILAEADIVVSTALHDFQGLSLLEAISRGCLPIAPNRVVYPEYIDKELLYSSSSKINETEALAQKLQFVMRHWQQCVSRGTFKYLQAYKKYSTQRLIPRYRNEIERLLS